MIKISKAIVLLTDTTDDITLFCDNLLNPMPKMSNQPLALRFSSPHNAGIEYVKEHFQIEPEIINNRRKVKKPIPRPRDYDEDAFSDLADFIITGKYPKKRYE